MLMKYFLWMNLADVYIIKTPGKEDWISFVICSYLWLNAGST